MLKFAAHAPTRYREVVLTVSKSGLTFNNAQNTEESFPVIGQTISHYLILSKIGEGGMGAVYVAEETLLGRRVAVKSLKVSSAQAHKSFRTRFLREARARRYSITHTSQPSTTTARQKLGNRSSSWS